MARGGETNCNGKIFSGGFSGVGGSGCRDDSGGGGLIQVSHYSSFSCFSDGEMTGRDEKRLKKAFGRTSEGRIELQLY